MTFLPFWAGGLALAGVMVLHWLLTRRMMAVSGRVTALVNEARNPTEEAPQMSEAELAAALAEATRDAFGDAAVEAAEAAPRPATEPKKTALPPQRPVTHFAFFGGVALGGLLSYLLAGGAPVSATLRSATFDGFFGSGPLAWGVLAFGGVLIGFGTRMAGGCTSGHGLCGTSRFQLGSLVSTASFFGTAIVVSLVLGALL